MLFWIALIFLLTYLLNKFYFQPMRVRKEYMKTLKNLGYRVYQLPYKPFGAPIFESMAKYEVEKKDALYGNKYVYQGYDVIMTNILNFPQLVFVNYKLSQQVVSSDKVNIFPKVASPLQLLIYSFGKGVIFLEGDQWKSRRKILSKAFTYDFLKDLIPLMSELFDECFDKLENTSTQSNGEISVELHHFGSQLFSQIIIAGFIGKDVLDEKIQDQQIQQFALDATYLAVEISRDPLTLLLGVKFFKLGLLEKHKKLERKLTILKAHIKNKISVLKNQFMEMNQEQKKKSKNLVHLVLYQAELEKQSLSDDSILDEILTFLVAGSQTTAILFATFILNIFEHKQVEKKIRDQIKQFIKSEKDFNNDTLKQMKYLECVQLQTLRLSAGGQGLLDRISTVSTNISDIPIRQNTIVNYMIRTTLYNDAIFENAKEFNPERWRQPNQELLNMVMMGFSLGPRTCIGKQLALIESKVAVIKFMQRFQSLKQLHERQFVFKIAYTLKNSTVILRKSKQ